MHVLLDIFVFFAFPVSRWQKLHSNNHRNRPNREIGRRTDTVGVFPNRAVGTAAAGQHYDCREGRRRLTLTIDINHEALP